MCPGSGALGDGDEAEGVPVGPSYPDGGTLTGGAGEGAVAPRAGVGQPMMLVDHRAERRDRGFCPQPTGAGVGDVPRQPAWGEGCISGPRSGAGARTAA